MVGACVVGACVVATFAAVSVVDVSEAVMLWTWTAEWSPPAELPGRPQDVVSVFVSVFQSRE